MASTIKHFEEDILHYQRMIKTEEEFFDAMTQKRDEFKHNEVLRQKIEEQIDNSLGYIETYKNKINNLIEKGDING